MVGSLRMGGQVGVTRAVVEIKVEAEPVGEVDEEEDDAPDVTGEDGEDGAGRRGGGRLASAREEDNDFAPPDVVGVVARFWGRRIGRRRA